MSKSCPELLREAANLIAEALSRTPPAPASQSQQIPAAAPSRTPVQGKLIHFMLAGCATNAVIRYTAVG